MESIENFKYDDLDECVNLYIKAFNQAPWNDKWNFNTGRKRLEDIYKTPNFKGLVYKKDGKIIGAAMGNYEHWYEGLQYNLKEIFIDVSIQKSGVGRNILEFLEKNLKETGVNSIYLFTARVDKTEGFYKRNGYKIPNEITIMTKSI